MKTGRTLVGALLLCGGTVASAGSGFWSSNGPWGGVVYDMHVPGGAAGATTAYASTRGGLFRTIDAGFSWERVDTSVPGGLALAGPLVIDDLLPAQLTGMDSRGRLYRSSDSAGSWVPTGFQLDPDVYDWARLADLPGTSSGLLMAAGSYSVVPPAGVSVFLSTDGGASFVALGGGLPAGTSWGAVAVDPDNASTMLVGTSGRNLDSSGVASPPALYRSSDGGATWTAVLSVVGLTDASTAVDAIAFGPGDSVYAVAQYALYRSDDGGLNWTGPLAGGAQALLPDPGVAHRLLMGSSGGVSVSLDGGVTGTSLNNGLSTNPSYASSLTGLPPASVVTGLAAESAWPAPGAALWAATDGGGVFRSTDGGASWTTANNGIAAINVRAVAVHPNPSATNASGQGSRIYAGFGDTFQGSPALFLSADTGATWGISNNQLRASQIRAIAIDPTTAGLSAPAIAASHVYAAGGSVIVEGFINGGLYKSTNGGTTWTVLDGNLPTSDFGGQIAPWLGTVRNIVLDPRSCSLPIPPFAAPCSSGPLQRVYATATGSQAFDAVSGTTIRTHRIIRSDDAGATWTALDGDLPQFRSSSTFAYVDVVPLPLVLGSSDPGVLYVGTFSSVGGDVAAAGGDVETGVFRSADGGVTWEQRSGGLPRVAGFANIVVDVLAMAIHPADDDILWAVTHDLVGGSPVPALHKTVDGGLTWTPSASGLPMGIDLRALLVDPGDPDILYTSGYYPGGDDGSGSFANPPGVFRSDDGGATWLSISAGLMARSVLAMTLDPFRPQVLHIGTNTGLWSMEQVADADGDGVPDAMENFAPDGGDGDGDGIMDAQQANVGSMVANLQRPGSKAGGGYTTSRISAVDGSCAQAVDVQAQLAARFGRDYLPDGRDYFRYPRDLVRLEIMDCAAAEVDLIFHGADFLREGWSFRMYGPSTPGDDNTVGWHDLSARAEVLAPDRWRLLLERDAMGSFRSGGESILFMGGPACHDTRIFQDTFETGYVAPPGCDD